MRERWGHYWKDVARSYFFRERICKVQKVLCVLTFICFCAIATKCSGLTCSGCRRCCFPCGLWTPCWAWAGEGSWGTGGKMAVSAKTGFALHFTALQILLTLTWHNSLLFQKLHQTDLKANTEIPFTLHLWHSVHYLSALKSESSENISSIKVKSYRIWWIFNVEPL